MRPRMITPRMDRTVKKRKEPMSSPPAVTAGSRIGGSGVRLTPSVPGNALASSLLTSRAA